ncbi:hypothetical protein M9458_013018 [Cirrhinus mrigala]|uniref:Uncharacterized protein n=1 Tax=Cirrhinus mrigala TaxID=683832 RepID=A0ABD0QVV3_CIRMR
MRAVRCVTGVSAIAEGIRCIFTRVRTGSSPPPALQRNPAPSHPCWPRKPSAT